ncbi:GntR family transcriptional regulator [Aeromicrobium chenweiae]|uniref:GntR family transcriptional regulator n=1 Tax=Aeromicrobium chenweiae TaxID=2079793 RepID=A0A2S0WPM8_9ACTN|nr:GntR family transcriptional regulator [Aeromicrobium chenweiae]AWB93295.1 GntR family transcriptional regulator [Aeromicrobium chenweiae]TGN34288.1 GntR family transcriptional regulator [Aeromicrobium chenweiae]
MSLDVTIEATGAEPPFEQLRRQVAEQADDGRLPAGHRLPTVRALAETLGLATNTVAKAYRALEVDGVIETHGRAGTFIASRRLDDAESDAAAQAYARLARRQGLSQQEALRLVERHWTS